MLHNISPKLSGLKQLIYHVHVAEGHLGLSWPKWELLRCLSFSVSALYVM